MTRRNLFLAILLITTTAAISIAAVLLWSRSTSTPQTSLSPVAAPANDSPAVAQLKSHAPGAAKEGIKVHGHWTIDIRNPDGKLVERREFNNALEPGGGESLGGLLQRTHKMGEWKIVFGSANPPCLFNSETTSYCHIFAPNTQSGPASDPNAFKTLTTESQGYPTMATVLSGTATAARTGAIDLVSTSLSKCAYDTQGVCNPNLLGNGFGVFTRTTLATPINVVAGQIIQVTVVISFS